MIFYWSTFTHRQKRTQKNEIGNWPSLRVHEIDTSVSINSLIFNFVHPKIKQMLELSAQITEREGIAFGVVDLSMSH